MAARPPASQHTAPPTDPRLRNTTNGDQSKTLICRDFVWGICNKGVLCKFRHELEFDSMRGILKFCHDYQNKTGCNRPDCTYLHVSREEENLFLTTGQVPRVLAARHSAAMSCGNIYGLTSDSLTAPPPPPPPPVTAPPPLPMALPVLMPPPPPPPPTTVVTPVQMTTPIFTAPPPVNPAIFQANQPQPQPQLQILPTFDATRPPPPLTGVKTGATKRTAEPMQAGPSKLLIRDAFKEDGFCENCGQLDLRIKVHKQTIEKLEHEREYKTYMYEKKMEEYDNGKLLLKSAVSPDLYRLLDEYIEGTSSQLGQVHDLLAHFGGSSPFMSGTSTVPKQFMLQLMDWVFRDPRSSLESSPLSSSGDDESSFLQTLAKLTNRPSPTLSTNVLQALIEVIRNSPNKSSNDKSPSSSTTPMKNGQGRSLSSKPDLQPSAAPSQPYLTTAPIASQFSFVEPAVPAAMPVTATAPQAPGPSSYVYQPNVPPPNVRPPYYNNVPYAEPVHTAPMPPRAAPPTPYAYQRYPPHGYYQPPYQ